MTTQQHTPRKIFALVTAQGTACPETVLLEREYTEAWRAAMEAVYCKGRPDDPLPGTWCDVSDNAECQP